MKSFAASVTAFALLSIIFAKDSGKNGTQLEGENPIFLDEPVDVSFHSTLYHTSNDDSKDPINTFIFSISSPPKDQKLSINVTGIRTALPNVELSVSQCNWSGEFCYPEFPETIESETRRAFDHTQFANGNNVTLLDISKVASNGTFFFFYLQVVMETGYDNPPRSGNDHNPIPDTPEFFEIIDFKPKTNLPALTFSLSP